MTTKKHLASFSAICLIIYATLLPAVGQQSTLGLRSKRLPSKVKKSFESYLARVRAVRHLLLEKGVPFEPKALFAKDWRTDLAPSFEQMPELSEDRFNEGKLTG